MQIAMLNVIEFDVFSSVVGIVLELWVIGRERMKLVAMARLASCGGHFFQIFRSSLMLAMALAAFRCLFRPRDG